MKGTKICWDSIKALKNGLKKPTPVKERMMKKPDGTKCKSSEENAEVFRNHFEKLYDRHSTFDPEILNLLEQSPVLTVCEQRPTRNDIRKALCRLKNKAPSDSGITPLMLKACIHNEEYFSLLGNIILEVWDYESPPVCWDTGLLKVLPKKGDLSQPGNYRGIMLLEVAYKILAILIHDRLQPLIESLDHESQCGFRPGRGCQDAIFSVNMAMKKRREHNKETWILFLDLIKAFDRVPRVLLWSVLEKFGAPKKLICLIKSLHDNFKVDFEIENCKHSINCTIGVKQGDILGPALFVIFITAIMISWRKMYNRPLCVFRTRNDFCLTGRRINSTGTDFDFPDSEYADDTAVLYESHEDVVLYTPLLLTHFDRFGMEVHAGDISLSDKPPKTEILLVSAPPSCYHDPNTFDNTDLSPIELGEGKFIPITDRFCYLGKIMSRDDLDIINRIKRAGNAFGAIRKSIFSNSNVSTSVKASVYESLILPILLYGS